MIHDFCITVWSALQERIESLRRHPEAGYSTEAVLVTALMVGLAIVVVAIVAAKVTAKANSIDLGP